MGLFDLPGPLLSAVDSLFAGLPPYPRLLIWAGITGIVSMALYWLCSAQDRVGAAKERAVKARQQMAAYEGTEFDEMWPLARESLVASLKHFGIVLGPALLSSLPALALIVWVSNEFGYVLPEPGDRLTAFTQPETELTGLPRLEDPDVQAYEVIYPADSDKLALVNGGGETLTTLPLSGAVPVVHKRVWWNSLIGNPNGYIPDDYATDAIYFDLRSQEFLRFGPAG